MILCCPGLPQTSTSPPNKMGATPEPNVDTPLETTVRYNNWIQQLGTTMTASMPHKPFLTGSTAVRFVAIQHCLVPRSKTFNSAEAQASKDIINQLLANQDAKATRKLFIFLVLIDLISLCRYAKRFCRLSSKQQTSISQALFDSPISLLRKGFWGLNTLSRLGVYGQPGLHEEIGYRLRSNPNDN